MNNVEARLARCFLAVFPELDTNEVTHASSSSVPSWDSVAVVTLQAAIEEEFDLSIDSEDIAQFESFDRILNYLNDAQMGNGHSAPSSS